MKNDNRISGIDVIGGISWGTHFCQFYQTKEDLLDILVPYFKAGLENNEFCLWVISEPLDEEKAKEALKKVIPEIDVYMKKGQIEIIHQAYWHAKEDTLDPQMALNHLLEKNNKTLASGYDGLRYSGNYFFGHERLLDSAVGKYPIIALCTYLLEICNVTTSFDIVANHKFALIKREGKWEIMESSCQKIKDCKQTGNAQQEAEERYRAIFDNSLDCIIFTTQDGTILAANPAASQMFEMTDEELSRAGTSEIVDMADPRFKSAQEERARTGKFKGELNHKRKDGTIFPSEISSTLFKDKNGFMKVVTIIRDITKRKEAEAKLKQARDNLENLIKERIAELEQAYMSLKESENGLAEAQRIAHIGNWTWDLVNDVKYWSDEAYRIFGLKPQEFKVTYDTFLSYIHPKDRDYVDNATKEALKRKPYSIDFRIIIADGEERIVHEEGEVVFDENSNPVKMLGTTQDITEYKEAEQALRDSEEKYRNIVETANEGILITNDENIITYVNKKLAHMLKFSSIEVIGRQIWGFIDTKYIHMVKMNLEKRRRGISESNEFKLKRKDGSSLWVFVNAKPLFDQDGKYIGVMSMLTDITKRKEAEKALKDFEINRKKEIHHRIKNNLQVISSLLDLQAEKFKGRKNIKDSEVMSAFTESQDRIISIALIYEELYKGENIDVLNFSQYIKELAENLLLIYKLETDVSLNIDMEENILFDVDVAIPLGMIVNELVSNSLKYAFQGRDIGIIQIKLHKDKKGECKVEGCKSSNYVLTVLDNGVGIPENLDIEELDSLGLQLVTSLVDQLDGKLEINRKNGTEFIVRFTVTDKINLTSMPANN